VIDAARAFGRFWLDFVVGDDWRIAAGILVLIAVGGWLVHDRAVRTDLIAVGVPVLLVALVAASIWRDGSRQRH
jgi:hypothetical protein